MAYAGARAANARKNQGTTKQNETAWRAVREFSKLLPTMTTFARSITGNREITVKGTGQGASTDGKTIYIQPPLSLGADFQHPDRSQCGKRGPGKRQLCRACDARENVLWSLYHEIGHIAGKSFAEMPEYQVKSLHEMVDLWHPPGICDHGARIKYQMEAFPYALDKTGCLTEWLPQIIRSLEDVRVDNKMIRARPGLKMIRRARNLHIFTEGVPDNQGGFTHWGEQKLNAQIVIGILLIGADDEECVPFLSEEAQQLLADEKLYEIAHRAPIADSVHQIVDIAMEAWVRLNEMGLCYTPKCEPPPPPPPPMPSLNKEEDPDGGESDGPSEPDDSDDGSDDTDRSDDPAGSSGEDSEDSTDGSSDESSASSGSESDDGDSADESDESDEDFGDEFENESTHGGGHRQEPEEGTADEASDEDAVPDDDGTDGNNSDGDQGDADPEGEGEDHSNAGNDTGDEPMEDEESDEDSSTGGTGNGSPGSGTSGSVDESGDQGDESASDGSGNDRGESGSNDSSSDERREGTPVAEDESPGPSAEDGDQLESNEPTGKEPVGEGVWGEPYEEAGEPIEIIELIERMSGHNQNNEPEDEVIQEMLAEAGVLPIVTESTEQRLVNTALDQSGWFDGPSQAVGGVINVQFPEKGFDWRKRSDQRAEDFMPAEQVIGSSLMKARIVFSENKRGKEVRNLKSGRVNARVLAKRAPANDERLFQKRYQPGKRSYFVLIGLDCSGSNRSYRKMERAKRAVFAQAELLHRLGIPFAVYAHTGGIPEWVDWPATLNDFHKVWLLDIKTPGQPWNDDARERLASVQPVAENYDGHTLQIYRKMLQSRLETDRILMYYTDGAMPAANYDEELTILQSELLECKKRKIVLMAVGINTDSPLRYGFDTVKVENDSDLAKVVDHLGRRLANG